MLDPGYLSKKDVVNDKSFTSSNEDPDSLDLTDTKEDPVSNSIYYRYYDIMGKGFELYKRDLDSLYPGEHLSDRIVNYCLSLCCNRSIFLVPSYITNYIIDQAFSNQMAISFFKDIHLLECRLLLLPYSEKDHWVFFAVLFLKSVLGPP